MASAVGVLVDEVMLGCAVDDCFSFINEERDADALSGESVANSAVSCSFVESPIIPNYLSNPVNQHIRQEQDQMDASEVLSTEGLTPDVSTTYSSGGVDLTRAGNSAMGTHFQTSVHYMENLNVEGTATVEPSLKKFKKGNPVRNGCDNGTVPLSLGFLNTFPAEPVKGTDDTIAHPMPMISSQISSDLKPKQYSNTNTNIQQSLQSDYEMEPIHEPSVVTLPAHSMVTEPEVRKPDPEASTVTPISEDNAQSIYVNGDAQQRGLKATSVYLNAEGNRVDNYVPPYDRSAPVTIKISPSPSISDHFSKLDCISLNNNFERSTEVHKTLRTDDCDNSGGARVQCVDEIQKPFANSGFGKLESDCDGERRGSVNACDDESVLHVGDIHCDILDELFDDIMKNEAKMMQQLIDSEGISLGSKTMEDVADQDEEKNDVNMDECRDVCGHSKQDFQDGIASKRTLRSSKPMYSASETEKSLNFVVPTRTLTTRTLECAIPGETCEESLVECAAWGSPSPRGDGWEEGGTWGEGPVAPHAVIGSDDRSLACNLDHENAERGCADHCIKKWGAEESTGAQETPHDQAHKPDSSQNIETDTDDVIGYNFTASAPAGVMNESLNLPALTSSPSVCGDSEDRSRHETGLMGDPDGWRDHADSPNITQTIRGNDFDADCESSEDNRTGLAAAVSRVVRQSMRRMGRMRLSGRRSPRRICRGNNEVGGNAGMSEETEVRRDLPVAPVRGLSTVRSPAAASIIVTSLMAALAPPPLHAPREVLDPPPINTSIRSQGGRRRPSRHYRNSSVEHYDPPTEPSAPLSLEVEVGGYLPISPVNLDSELYTLSSPPSLVTEGTEGTWEVAAAIPRPSFTSSAHVQRLSSSHHAHSITASPGGEGESSEASRDAAEIRRAHRRSDHVSGDTNSNSNNSNSSDSSNVPSTSSSSSGRVNSTITNEAHHRSSNNTLEGTRRSSHISQGGNTNITERSSRSNEENTRNTNSSERNNRSNSNRDNRSNRNRDNRNSSSRDSGSSNSRDNSEQQNPRRNAYTVAASGVGVEVAEQTGQLAGTTWGHSHSGLLASLAVTVTTFNISRFAILGARFGWPFVVQWLVVSAVLGLPLMTFHATVGQYLGAGVVDMWKISPIFQGVGYSILVAQTLVGLYCCVPIAWLFIFFRDSFITHNNMFRWADCRLVNCSVFNNFSTIIIEGVPKYFNSQVLQRGDGESTWLQELGSLKFDMAFNIALIWLITLTALSRGNQTYGKVCYIVFLLPLLCYLVVCLYLASWTKDDLYINDVTKFNELFMNSRSWMAASREVFLVWGFHGAVLQQMAAHNKRGHALYRDTTILSVVTALVLVLAAVTGSSCVSGLHQNNLHYKPSSFENAENAQFLLESKVQHKKMFETLLKHFHMGNLPPHFLAEYMYHDNFYAGIRIRPPKIGNVKRTEADDQSGYQSLRLATELFPALLAVNGAQHISPFWSSLFYLSLLLFGIAQQLAVWRTIVEAVIRINQERLQAWETFITFLCCLFGFSAALPMATGAGIHILYFFDYVVSCGWWLMIIQLVQIFALLFVRGKPYSGQDIVSELMGKNEQCRSLWLGPLTSFAWNIIVPVGLLVLSISSFKSGQYRDVFAWGSDSYWPVWVCQLASALQLFPILLVPLIGLIQTCRYLAATDDDLFERIQLLYRPSLRQHTNGNDSFLSVTEESELDGLGGARDGQQESGTTLTPRPFSDPPPKYTPPPSYSTATGVRFAKLLNRSLRESIRRLRGTVRHGTEINTNTDAEGTPQADECGEPSTTAARIATPYIPPPDYVTAVTECGTDRNQSSTSYDSPPQYSTLDPLRRQQALAALANPASSGRCAKTDGETELPLPTSVLHRNNSLRRSGLRRSIASGVRRSARRLAVTLGMGGGEDGATLVNSETPVGQDSHMGREAGQPHPFAYTNFELVSHSDA
ncbi:uncharacterized protein bdg [Panulirus ornatus]|uniref:uncharacterized protein bdg n=1 Tax=Panulirus ornatus TaxID=150431 RepID=UPI003A8934A3